LLKHSNNLATSTKQSHLPVTQLDADHASRLDGREVDRIHPFDLLSSALRRNNTFTIYIVSRYLCYVNWLGRCYLWRNSYDNTCKI